MFDCDSWSDSQSNLEYYTSLAKETQLILLNLGIFSNKTEKYLEEYDHTYNSLNIRAEEFEKLKSLFEYKSLKYNFRKVDKKRNPNIKTIPYLNKIIIKKIKELKIKLNVLQNGMFKLNNITKRFTIGSAFNRIKPKNNVTYYSLQKFYNSIVVENFNNFQEIRYIKKIIQKVKRKNYLYDTIESIEIKTGKFKVYDFSIPRLHNFYSDGFISHNSSFLECVIWTIYGKNSKGLLADQVINWYEREDCFGIFTFFKNGKTYRFERYRKHHEHKNDVIVFEDDKNITWAANIQVQIEEIFDVEYEALISTIFLSKKKMDKFLSYSKAEKEKLFSSIMQLSLIDPYEKKVRARTLVMKKETDRLDKSIFSLEEKSAEAEKLLKTAQNEVDTKLKRLGEENDKENESLQKLSALPLSALKSYYKNLTKAEEIEYDIDKKETEIEIISDTVKDTKKLIKTTAKNICTQCEQEIPHKMHNKLSKQFNETLEGLKEEKKEFKAAIRDLKVDLAVMEKEETILLERIEGLMNDKGEITIAEENISAYENQINNCKRNIERIIADIEYTKKDVNLTQIKQLLEEALKQLTKNRQEMAVYKEEEKLSSVWMKAFDKKDDIYIKRILMANLIADLNMYLERRVVIFNWDEVNFAKFDEDKELIVTITNEVDEQMEIPYKALSDGEDRKMNLCINLALNDLIYVQFSRISLALFDEISDGLDKESNAILAKVIDEFSLKVPVHIISHVTEFNAHFSDVIGVEKYEEGSKKFSRFI